LVSMRGSTPQSSTTAGALAAAGDPSILNLS
jgi:hypothetical protein